MEYKSYPEGLRYALSKSSCSRNSFRLELKGGNSGSSGQVLFLELPSNSLVDLSTLCMYFNAVASTTTANNHCRFPNKWESLIQRIDIDVGSTALGSFNSYAEVCHIKDLMLSAADLQTHYLTNHETIPRDDVMDYLQNQGGDASSGANETLNNVCLSRWLGALGESTPNVWDTGLMPPITIKITLNTNNVLSVGTNNTMTADGAATGSYSLTGIYFVVDVISFSDGIYDSMVNNMLSSQGVIKIPFKNYSTTTSTTNTTRWSVSAQSIDAVYAVFRDPTYNTQKAPYAIQQPAASGVTKTLIETISSYFRFQQRGITSYQFKANGVLFPQNRATPQQAFMALLSMTKNRMSSIGSYRQFLDSHFVLPLKLNCSDHIHQLSGFDSRGTNCTMELAVDGMTAGTEVLIVTEFTSVLLVAPGKSCTVDP